MKRRWKVLWGMAMLAAVLTGGQAQAQSIQEEPESVFEIYGEEAPVGYEGSEETSKPSPQKKARSQEYQVTDTIRAVLENGVLSFQGTGEIPDYGEGNPPWENEEVRSVTIGQGITGVGEAAFYQMSLLESVTFADSVEVIGYGAFADCFGLSEIQWGAGLRELSDYAFQNAAVQRVELPASVTSLSPHAFFSCYGLQEIDVAGENGTYASVDGVVFNKALTKLVLYPMGNGREIYQIPSGVTEIGEAAFGRAGSLREIQIPSSVTTIGDWAFNGSRLERAVIPDSVKTVGYGPFSGCSYLREAVIGGGFGELPYQCFKECSSLQSVTLKAGITDIAHQAFLYCSSLESIQIPEGVQNIKGSAFYGCTNLKRAVLPSSLLQLWNQAFCYCESLSQINLPGNLEFIGPEAFYGCKSLGSLEIPGTVTEIGADAFGECPGLSLKVPSGLTQQEDGSYIMAGTLNLAGTKSYTKAYQVLNQVNIERQKEGLSPLTMDTSLLEAAMVRATEIAVDFSHDRPNGQTCFSISQKAMGENIAAGSSTAEGVMDQWMNSPGHRGNILGSDYQSIGIGCFQQNGVWYWVQLFGQVQGENVSKTGEETGTYPVMIKEGVYRVYCDFDSRNMNQGTSESIPIYVENPGWPGIRVTVRPESLTWNSSNPAVASVSQTGVVTAQSAGSAVITGQVKGMPKMQISLTFHVTSSPGNAGNTGGTKPQTQPQKSSAQSEKKKAPAKPKLKSVKAGKKKAVVKWKAQKGVKGYQIYVSRKKNKGYKKVKTIKKAKTTQWTVKKLKSKKTYYIKIRSYKTVKKKNVYSKYSAVKKVRVK